MSELGCQTISGLCSSNCKYTPLRQRNFLPEQKPTQNPDQQTMITDHPTTLFVSPKRGGILQSSGFLDLKSLMALSRTCKANAFDELSLTLFIENEITRYHGVDTMEEAIVFCRKLYRRPLLRRWLERDYEPIQVSIATRYEVMLAKMLRVVPTESERYQLVSEKDKPGGGALLHDAAKLGNPESIRTVLALYPESERLQVLDLEDNYGETALYCAALLGNFKLHCIHFKTLLAVYPESERLQALNRRTTHLSETVLHLGARSKVEVIKNLLSYGRTVLDNMNEETRNSIMNWLSQSENSDRSDTPQYH